MQGSLKITMNGKKKKKNYCIFIIKFIAQSNIFSIIISLYTPLLI